MKTLIVSFIPRGERSKTKKLLDTFIANTEGQDVEVLDLTKDVPDMFISDNLMAYMKRNYGGEILTPADIKQLAKIDRMTAQFKQADVVVIAFPMYNFSTPAIIKAYFDSIILKGETWDLGEKGFVGLMTGKKALVLMSSGGVYEGETAGYEHAMTLTKGLFQFMGFEDVRGVSAAGMNMGGMGVDVDAVVSKAQDDVSNVVGEWY